MIRTPKILHCGFSAGVARVRAGSWGSQAHSHMHEEHCTEAYLFRRTIVSKQNQKCQNGCGYNYYISHGRHFFEASFVGSTTYEDLFICGGVLVVVTSTSTVPLIRIFQRHAGYAKSLVSHIFGAHNFWRYTIRRSGAPPDPHNVGAVHPRTPIKF